MLFKTSFWIGLLYMVGFCSFALAETVDQWNSLGSAALFDHVVRESSVWPMLTVQFVGSLI